MSVSLSLLHFSNKVLSLLRRRFCARVLCGLSEVDDDGGSERREILCFIYFFFIGLSLLPLSFFFLDLYHLSQSVEKKSEKEEEEERREELSKKEKRRDELFFFFFVETGELYTNKPLGLFLLRYKKRSLH